MHGEQVHQAHSVCGSTEDARSLIEDEKLRELMKKEKRLTGLLPMHANRIEAAVTRKIGRA